MPGCIVSATTASFRSVEKRRRRATPVITSTFENVSDIGVCLGLYLGPPAKAGVRSKQGAVHSGNTTASGRCGGAGGWLLSRARRSPLHLAQVLPCPRTVRRTDQQGPKKPSVGW